MPVPTVYRRYSENVIASYTGVDIANGRGITPFYAGDHSYNATTNGTYALSTIPFYADAGYTSISGSGAKFNLTFDLAVKRTITIEGDCTFSVPMKLTTAGGAGLIGDVQVILQRISGGVTTTIGTVHSRHENLPNGTSGIVYTMVFSTTRISFKAGDTMRLNVQTLAGLDAFGAFTIVHDPKGRSTINGTSFSILDSTQLIAYLPVVIDL